MATAYLWMTGGMIGLVVAFVMMLLLLVVVLIDVRRAAAEVDADLEDLLQ